jgi:hypothetical protein
MKQTPEKKLSKLFNAMDSESQGHLLAYAQYLASKSQPARDDFSKPKLLEGDADESVIQAIKRLSQCYPMLQKSRLLNDTSALMTQHMMQGRERVEVIRELEVVFASHYQQYLDENKEE